MSHVGEGVEVAWGYYIVGLHGHVDEVISMEGCLSLENFLCSCTFLS